MFDARRSRKKRRAMMLAVLVGVLAVFVVGAGPASAVDPSIWYVAVPNPLPGDATVTVYGEGWSGAGGVRLVQCADTPLTEDDYWTMCDPSTEVFAGTDPTWNTEFHVKAVLDVGDPFPPGTVNDMGNGTWDCQVNASGCEIFATEDDPGAGGYLSGASTHVEFRPLDPGLVAPAPKAVWEGPTTALVDGQEDTVRSTGHRPGSNAMTYVCPPTGWAFPGACDPVEGSEATVDGAGVYERRVSLPRYILSNDPFWTPDNEWDWYDGVNGVTLLVLSADNLSSDMWGEGEELTFADVSTDQYTELLTVTSVRVNKAGRITIDGLIDCSAAVARWGQSEYIAGVNVNWSARQTVGRKTAVTRKYESAIISLCHDPTKSGPYRWYTHPEITSSDIWWYPPDVGGKFVAGPIQVDVQVTGGTWSPSPHADAYLLMGVTQWYGKAVKG